MCRIVFSLLLFCSANVFAKSADVFEELDLTPLQVSNIFDEQDNRTLEGLPDLVDKEEKVTKCMTDYAAKQSKSYTKIVQNNLYDLVHNFDRIVSKVYGKKPATDVISYTEKVEALARIQCEAYYAMGTLK